jgi:hypothetical protein
MLDSFCAATYVMSAFTFARHDIWARNLKVWKRKYVRWIASHRMTVVLLATALFLYRISTNVPSTTMTITSDYQNSRATKQENIKIRTTRAPKTNEIATNSLYHQVDEHLESETSAAIVILAPQRHAISIWNIYRFCFLRRVIRSIDQHLNAHFGPYPILILMARDHDQDPTHQDAPYEYRDRALVEKWAPHSIIVWHEIDMYSSGALEQGVSLEQILAWRRGEDGGEGGRPLGYQSMCRLWSGRLQNMPNILDHFDYYMRLDDDSLFTSDLEYDPFVKFVQRNMTYVYRRSAEDHWGIQELWRMAQRYVLDPSLLDSSVKTQQEFLMRSGDDYEYFGNQPYNNFHISRVDFWRSQRWQAFMQDMDSHHLFFKHRVGDANVHAMALLMMGDNKWEEWSDFPYAHNSNDMGDDWGVQEWKTECDAA